MVSGEAATESHLSLQFCLLSRVNWKKTKGYLYFFINDKIFNMQTWAKFDFSSQGDGK